MYITFLRYFVGPQDKGGVPSYEEGLQNLP